MAFGAPPAGVGYSVNAPEVVTRPIWPVTYSVNQSAPSGPVVISQGPALAVGTVYSVIVGVCDADGPGVGVSVGLGVGAGVGVGVGVGDGAGYVPPGAKSAITYALAPVNVNTLTAPGKLTDPPEG